MALRNVLVTGANKGIGEAIVRKLLQQCDDVFVLLGSRNPENGHAAKQKIIQDIPSCKNKLEVVVIDVSSDDSVIAASKEVKEKYQSLYGIINNAGVMNANNYKDTLNVNFCGVNRVFEKFHHLLVSGGKVVNVTSASGPIFISRMEGGKCRSILTSKDVTMDQLDEVMSSYCSTRDAGTTPHEFGDINSDYGMSKALANAYTVLTAREHPTLIINACTPGYIATDLTGKAPGEGGAKAPEHGTYAPLRLLLDVKTSGWYFGSDGKRSPIDKYRAPGDEEYESDGDDEAETAL